MPAATSDVIVIGCGGFGAAAMYHLARRGLRVVGIDRFHPPHDRGSSHAETRIIRKAYFEHPDYVPLLHRAWDLWEQLSVESQRTLIEQRDLLLSGPEGSEVTAGARKSAKLHGLPLENLNFEDAQRCYPMFSLPEDHTFSLESTSGFLWCERCVRTHLELAAARGAVLNSDETVRRVNATATGVTVETDRTVYESAAGVLTCGAWTGQLLADYGQWITVRRKTVFWHPILSQTWTDPRRAPMFLFDLPEGQFYGLPSVDNLTIKVGEHTGGETVDDPSFVSRTITPEDALPVSRFVKFRLREVDAVARDAAVCMYSMSPDGHFLFDRHPEFPLVIAAGFSGHGFKFTSVLGEATADLIQYGRSSLPVSFLSAGRFVP